MPLPNLKQQCTAQNRNKQRRCLNPAAFGCKTCRYHGARRQIAKGTDHPNYKHGNRSQSGIKSFSKASQELDMIEDMAESIGMVASRRRGDVRDDYWFKVAESTGPRTQQGRNLCGAAKTLHGRETRAIRAKRQQALAELKLIERMGRGVGVLR